ncbi:hypothetical protein Pmani_029217 [Petrolisthes manimaculis]|uniref:CCHC-type domain-containing protein n=1 Tax=Petrolisthes manimaculis TaxID=1843537 RepID=A0AAE1P0D7_9EUCA|nr:hypothetical protein Pmani_031701 [Petrolisthes manimaculis]KAK4298436.1 hypothetical protein Pmani_029217 [Petrolisthes manimaculis]
MAEYQLLKEYAELGQTLGYSGEGLQKFVSELLQQERQRRTEERNEEKENLQLQLEIEKTILAATQAASTAPPSPQVAVPKPKLPGQEIKDTGSRQSETSKTTTTPHANVIREQDRVRRQCFLCHRSGHVARDCWTSGKGHKLQNVGSKEKDVTSAACKESTSNPTGSLSTGATIGDSFTHETTFSATSEAPGGSDASTVCWEDEEHPLTTEGTMTCEDPFSGMCLSPDDIEGAVVTRAQHRRDQQPRRPLKVVVEGGLENRPITIAEQESDENLLSHCQVNLRVFEVRDGGRKPAVAEEGVSPTLSVPESRVVW